MKKLFFSAALVVAFSLTSFAAEKEELSKNEVITKVETELKTKTEVKHTKQEDDTCVTVVIEWNDYGATEDGMYLKFNKIEIQVCF